MSERWRRIKRIVQEAAELRDAERSGFLDDACAGDAELRAEVQSLLATASDSFPAPELVASSVLKANMRLGAYVVAEPIGAGGMGEVYRARDTKLGRDVALKVLPSAFAKDAERVARFKREARLLATLNHTNIAAIHGLETSNGVDFLVLELVPGQTLAELLKSGPLPVEDAIKIAVQIAEALDAAHEKGVVHRDLKPANIKITPDDQIKVLDFGLAKAQEASPGQSLSDSPTLTALSTREGIILGTASYMSPEQVRGKGVDKRSDIFSFGVVLYELLTGKRAFPGNDVSEILAAVMRDEPDWSALPASTPAGLRKLLRGCLQKDRKERRRDIGDVRADLRELLSGESVDEVAVKPPARWQRVIPWVVAGLMAALALWLSSRPSPVDAPQVVRTSINVLPTTFPGSHLDISPDGTRIAYVAGDEPQTKLYSRHLDQDESVPITGTEGAIDIPYFSPDGEWIAFGTVLYGIKKVRLDGVGSVPLMANNDMPKGLVRGGSWGPNGNIVFGTIEKGLITMPEDGGPWEILTTPDSEGGAQWYVRPHVLPSGDAVLFTSNEGGGMHDYSIVVESLSTGERRRLARGINPHYVSTGHLIYARNKTLFAVPFDPDRLEVKGEGVPVQTGVRDAGNQHIFAISETGTLVYEPSRLTDRRLVLVDLEGRAEPLAVPAGPYNHIRFSPDGQQLALSTDDGKIHLFELEPERFSLLFDSFEDADGTAWTPKQPVWSPDGTRFAIAATAPGTGLKEEIFLVSVDGRGAVEHLVSSPALQQPQSWSPDGNRLLYGELVLATNWNMWELPLEPVGEPRRLVTVTSEGFHNFESPELSPDGRWLAYTSGDSGKDEVYVKPYDSLSGGRQVSMDGGIAPVWSPDGREIYYRNGERMMAVAIRTEPVFSAGRPRVLFEGAYFDLRGHNRTYDLSPDGKKFVMITREEQPKVTQLRVVQNWFEELKRLVPVN